MWNEIDIKFVFEKIREFQSLQVYFQSAGFIFYCI